MGTLGESAHLLGNTKMDGISLNKVDKMAGLSFENGLRLHFDSILLFENESYPSAYFLSVLAIEEIGKAWLIMDFLYQSVGERREKEWEEKFLERTYFHTVKQSSFAYNFDSPIATNRFFKSLYRGELEILKQNSIYVGLARNKGKINLKSRINNPLKIDQMKAQEQITNVNDCLLEFALGVMKQVYIVDSYCVENLLNRRLLPKLKNRWPLIGSKTKTRLKKLEKIK
jgi:AbiV family abortive infection protein